MVIPLGLVATIASLWTVFLRAKSVFLDWFEAIGFDYYQRIDCLFMLHSSLVISHSVRLICLYFINYVNRTI
jgi:hypothetical protein